MEKSLSYLLVDACVLPEIFQKVVEAKRLLHTGQCKTASEAASKLGISRSAFYKYKDRVFPVEEMGKEHIITLFFTVIDRPGVVSGILAALAAADASVLTINQNIPIGGIANLTISMRTQGMKAALQDLLAALAGAQGVKKIELIAGE